MNERRADEPETGAGADGAPAGAPSDIEAAHRVLGDHVPAGEWRVDPDGSLVNIRARTLFGLLPVNGFFDRFEGRLSAGEAEDGGEVTGEFGLLTASLQTGIDRRDEQLRSAELLNASEYPRIEFRLESLRAFTHQAERIIAEPQMKAKGEATLIGTVVAMEFPVTVIEHGDHLHIEAKPKLNLRDAGLRPRQPGLISRLVRVEVALTLRRR